MQLQYYKISKLNDTITIVLRISFSYTSYDDYKKEERKRTKEKLKLLQQDCREFLESIVLNFTHISPESNVQWFHEKNEIRCNYQFQNDALLQNHIDILKRNQFQEE
jgi:hypothetical protein